MTWLATQSLIKYPRTVKHLDTELRRRCNSGWLASISAGAPAHRVKSGGGRIRWRRFNKSSPTLVIIQKIPILCIWRAWIMTGPSICSMRMAYTNIYYLNVDLTES